MHHFRDFNLQFSLKHSTVQYILYSINTHQ